MEIKSMFSIALGESFCSPHEKRKEFPSKSFRKTVESYVERDRQRDEERKISLFPVPSKTTYLVFFHVKQ